ncbi:MAG TPA: glucosyltransferase domain-containing protein [Pseudomonadales bacterium]|nr:glucosyltransferase domain-containing protein [Pseudomonadales bacterium]
MLLVYLSIIGLIAYGGDVVNFSLNIDSENHAYGYGAKAAWVAQGRWGMYFLNAVLLPDAIMPVIPMLIAIAGSIVGALFFVNILSSSRGIADYFAAPVAIACPVIYFAFYFTTLGYGVGIAFAVTGWGMYMLTRWSTRGFCVAAACFCFGIAIYQAVLPMIAALFCLYLTSSVIEETGITVKTLIKRTIMFFLAMAVAYVLYELGKRFSLYYLGVSFDAGYISGFVSYKPSIEYFVSTFSKTLPLAINYYTGGSAYYLYNLVSLQVLFFLTAAISFVRIICAATSWLVRIMGVLLLLAAIVAPMSMHLMNNGYMPPRSVLGVSQVLAALVFFAMHGRSKILQGIVAALTIACIFNFCVINNRYAFSDAMVWQADRELSVQIQQRIAEVLPKVTPKSDRLAVYPIELVGWLEYTQNPIIVNREVIGSSFYKWGAGDVERTERLFKTMAVDRYRAATQQERLSVVEQAQNMPDWPYPGSVDVINGVIVIKFREYNNPNQFLAMCRPPFNTHPVCLKYLPPQ